MYSGGSGTQIDPYLIETAEHFYNIRENPSAHFKQVADLDFANFGEFIAPDGDFTGVYDGGNFSIKNAEIKGGLFGTVSGSSALVQNIKLEDSNIASIGDNTGGIAREVVSDAIIQFCRVIGGSITATHDNTGGLVGRMQKSTMRYCWASILVHGRRYVGGLLGYYAGGGWNLRGYLHNCYAVNDVFGTEGVGGILGGLGRQLDLKNCYAVGYIQGTNRVGGIVGSISSFSGQEPLVEGCFALNKGIIRTAGSAGSNFGRISGSSYLYLQNNLALENIKFYPDGLEE